MMDVFWKENNIIYNVLCVLITENEKLFDRSDARLYWKTVFHMMVVFHHIYVVNFSKCINLENDAAEIKMLKKYGLAYLTGWNFAFQMVFLSLALTYDLLQWLDKHKSNFGKRLRYVRDVVFNGLVVPFTCFVTFMFWCVYWIDRELVFPRVFDEVLPWWLNHCVHTNIIIVIAVETLLQSRRHPTDVKLERMCYIFVSLFYAVVFYSIYYFGNSWLYGVFGVMTWWQICLYQIGIWISAYIFYRMAFVINRFIHGPENLDEILAKEDLKSNGDLESKAQDLKQFGSGLRADGSELRSDGMKQKFEGGSEAKGPDESGDKEFENGMKSNETPVETKGQNGCDKTNDEREDGRRFNGDHQSGVGENGKDWKSIETNGTGEKDENGDLNKTFEKSWSTKYRTNRTEFENSSL